MPLYEYECPTHGRFEVTQRMSDASLTTCQVDACGKPVKKLLSSGSFALKGGGASSGSESAGPGCAGGACGTGSCAFG